LTYTLKGTHEFKIKQLFTHNLSRRFGALSRAALLQSQPARPWRWIGILWLIGLYLLGIAGLGIFFEWGQYDSEYHDWAQITAPRLQFLRTAVRAQVFPLHFSDPSTLHGWTLRYLAVPDAFISSQYYILAKLPLPWFNLVNVPHPLNAPWYMPGMGDGMGAWETTMFVGLLGLGLTMADLWQDLSVWRLSNRLKDFWIVFEDNKWFVNNNYGDTLYLGLVFGGLALTASTFLVLGWLTWREMHKKIAPKA